MASLFSLGPNPPQFLIHVSPLSIVVAAISLITILISAWIPSRRAARSTPIEAIRQSADIAIRPGRVRTSKLTYKLCGLPGILAQKNFKRNRRKYRATVLSLAMSIILFISASAFCDYLTSSTTGVMDVSEFDLSYESSIAPETEQIFDLLSSVDGVTQSASYKVLSMVMGHRQHGRPAV